MLTILVESCRSRRRVGPQALWSAGFHVAVAIGVMEATRRTVAAPPPHIVSTIAYHLPPREPPPPTPVASPVSPVSPVPAAPIVVPMPTTVETTVPLAEPGPPIDPSRFVLASVERSRCLTDCLAIDSLSGPVFREEVVDQPARLIDQPRPIYPRLLQVAGIEGRVVVEFVVDQTGAVEAASIRVAETTNSAFERSARDAVAGARFAAARIGANPVRQLVRQGISFRIDR